MWSADKAYRAGAYGEGVRFAEEALEIARMAFGERDERTLTSLNNLAALYDNQGRYNEAEPLYVQALERRRESLGPDHPDTLISLNNLAFLYVRQGRYSEAEPLYVQALERSREVLGANHPSTLTSLNNLAELYTRQDRYGEAEPLYVQALERRRESLGPNHPDTLFSLNNLAALYQEQGRYGEAEPLLEQVLERSREVLGADHPSTLISLNNLALLYWSQGRYGEAEPLFERAWSAARGALGAAHPHTLLIHLNSAVNLGAQERWDEAAERVRQMEPHLLTWLGAELYSTEAEAVRRQLAGNQASYQHLALSLGVMENAGTSMRALAASAVLRFKGLQAEEEGNLASIVREGKDPKAAELAIEVAGLRAALARVFHGGATPNEMKALQRQLEAKELALSRTSRTYEQHLQVRSASLDDLRAGLPHGTGLLEIRQYWPADFKQRRLGELRYTGIMIIGSDTLKVVDLGPVEPSIKEVDALVSGANADAAAKAARALYERILAPFAEELKALDILVIAPDGPLILAPLARLQDGEGRLLTEILDIRMVQTGRDLLRPPADRPGAGLLALGGIDFDNHQTQHAATEPDDLTAGPFVPNPETVRSATTEAFRGRFKPLLGTAEEVEEIAWRYRAARPDEPVNVWTGAEATEQRLKSLVRSPRVLHLATHGFYRRPNGPLDRPMVLAGVSLAGANAALAEGSDDGILYAIEAQGLNLEGAELVVLSACETARGVVDYSEGVYGLARALRTAGARNVLVTLRPVGDIATRDFMTAFYEHWLTQTHSDPAAALRATQLDYIKNNRLPEIWAPYVIVGR
jgi:CHAT domain-containing protein/Flp pilus assembly protein TadD